MDPDADTLALAGDMVLVLLFGLLADVISATISSIVVFAKIRRPCWFLISSRSDA